MTPFQEWVANACIWFLIVLWIVGMCAYPKVFVTITVVVFLGAVLVGTLGAFKGAAEGVAEAIHRAIK